MGKALAKALLTPVGTGEMLTSAGEVERYIEQDAVDLVLHDAPRIGGITPFLKVAAQAQKQRIDDGAAFVMENHIHLAAAYPLETWVEHFEWLESVFNERLRIADGKMWVPDRPGLGLSLHERVQQWTVAKVVINAQS